VWQWCGQLAGGAASHEDAPLPACWSIRHGGSPGQWSSGVAAAGKCCNAGGWHGGGGMGKTGSTVEAEYGRQAAW
jgi:hypothetical protein